MSAINPYNIDLENLSLLALEQRIGLPKCQGIYLVLSEQKEVLYIGRSKNIHSRWKSHERYQHLRELPGVSIAWIEVNNDFLFRCIERALIEFFKPKFNDPKYTPPKPEKKATRIGIVNLRKRLNLTQRQVALAAGITEQTISNWEVGLYRIRLTPSQTLNLCRVLQCSLEELVIAQRETKSVNSQNPPTLSEI